MRIDLYGLVHKAQRSRLLTFAQQLARADLHDPTTRTQLESSVRELAELLRDHAENEQRYIHPLFAAVGPAAETLAAEHLELEAAIVDWCALAEASRWDELYRASMLIVARYLLHIDAEEQAQADVLWPHYSDAQLSEVMTRFKAERAPEDGRRDLVLFITSLSAPDLVDFLRGFSSAPEPLRADVFGLAQRLLGAERWHAVAARLA